MMDVNGSCCCLVMDRFLNEVLVVLMVVVIDCGMLLCVQVLEEVILVFIVFFWGQVLVVCINDVELVLLVVGVFIVLYWYCVMFDCKVFFWVWLLDIVRCVMVDYQCC